MTLAITRLDLTAEALRRAARSRKDVAQARRCLAIASVLEGCPRTGAAERAGMRRQTLRDWVHRYNADGIAGLLDRPRPVRSGLLNAEQRAAFDAIVEAGPEVAVDGVVRWRRVDLKRVVERRFGVVMAERTIGDRCVAAASAISRCGRVTRTATRRSRGISKNLRRPRRAGDPREGQRQTARDRVSRSAPFGSRRSPDRPEGHAGLRLGTRPRAVQDTRYAAAYRFGAVCPQRGVGAGLVMPRADTEGLNAHLIEIARTVAPGAQAVLILDGAGWHKSDALVVPEAISLLILPPCSPELNPVENIWQSLRRNKLAHRLHDTYEAIVEACCEAWNFLIAAPGTITSIAARDWANVSA